MNIKDIAVLSEELRSTSFWELDHVGFGIGQPWRMMIDVKSEEDFKDKHQAMMLKFKMDVEQAIYLGLDDGSCGILNQIGVKQIFTDRRWLPNTVNGILGSFIEHIQDSHTHLLIPMTLYNDLQGLWLEDNNQKIVLLTKKLQETHPDLQISANTYCDQVDRAVLLSAGERNFKHRISFTIPELVEVTPISALFKGRIGKVECDLDDLVYINGV